MWPTWLQSYKHRIVQAILIESVFISRIHLTELLVMIDIVSLGVESEFLGPKVRSTRSRWAVADRGDQWGQIEWNRQLSLYTTPPDTFPLYLNITWRWRLSWKFWSESPSSWSDPTLVLCYGCEVQSITELSSLFNQDGRMSESDPTVLVVGLALWTLTAMRTNTIPSKYIDV